MNVPNGFNPQRREFLKTIKSKHLSPIFDVSRFFNMYLYKIDNKPPYIRYNYYVLEWPRLWDWLGSVFHPIWPMYFKISHRYETANRLQIRRFLHPQNSQKSVLIYRFHLRKNHSEAMLRASVCCACALKTWVVESS